MQAPQGARLSHLSFLRLQFSQDVVRFFPAAEEVAAFFFGAEEDDSSPSSSAATSFCFLLPFLLVLPPSIGLGLSKDFCPFESLLLALEDRRLCGSFRVAGA